MDSAFSDIFLPATLTVITLGMGLSLTQKDFENIFSYPKAVITGIVCQMLLLPGLAFMIASMSNMPASAKVGLMIIAACPGGATSNLITYILRGNVALSISMTAINSLITLLTIPIIVTFSMDHFMHEGLQVVNQAGRLPVKSLNVGETMVNVFLVTLLPAYVGTRIRKWRPKLADGLEKYLKYIMPFMLILMYVGVVFVDRSDRSNTIRDSMGILPYALSLNLLALGSGLGIARALKLRVVNQFTISVEVGLQNSALAIFVASTLLEHDEIALVPVVYGSFSFFTTLLFGWLAKIMSRR